MLSIYSHLRISKINLFNPIFNKLSRRIACLMLGVTLLPSTYAQAAEPLGCIIEPERLAEVGSPVIGIVESVLVERGDLVKKGQVLATLRAEVERASVDVASTRSKMEADVRSAEAALKYAQVTQKRQEELVSKRFLSQQALDKAIADTAISEQKLVLSREVLRNSNSELSLARAQLGQRVIRSPISGIIADRYIWAGERVEEKPMFRVAQISPLRVEMVLSASLYGTVTKGMKLNVVPQIPNTQMLEANVVLVDKLIDGASNTFRVRAEIPNADSKIPSGLRCKVKLPDPITPVIRNDSGTSPTPNKTSTNNLLPSNMKYATFEVVNPNLNSNTNLANPSDASLANRVARSEKSKITKSLATNAQGEATQTFKIKPAKPSSTPRMSSTATGGMKWESQLNSLNQLSNAIKSKPTTQSLP